MHCSTKLIMNSLITKCTHAYRPKTWEITSKAFTLVQNRGFATTEAKDVTSNKLTDTHTLSSLSDGRIRNNWTKEEILSIYRSPLMELMYHSVCWMTLVFSLLYIYFLNLLIFLFCSSLLFFCIVP